MNSVQFAAFMQELSAARYWAGVGGESGAFSHHFDEICTDTYIDFGRLSRWNGFNDVNTEKVTEGTLFLCPFCLVGMRLTLALSSAALHGQGGREIAGSYFMVAYHSFASLVSCSPPSAYHSATI